MGEIRRPKYRDREEAGEILAERLKSYRSSNAIVLAIPNGGAAVGVAVARKLNCELDLIVVRKIQIPGYSEAGFGSVTSDGTVILNEPLIRQLGLTEDEIETQKRKAMRSIQRRLIKYKAITEFPHLKGRPVILVDDGLASGITMEAAVLTVREYEPREVVVAIPTSSMKAYHHLLPLVDKLTCPDISSLPIFAVAEAYQRWYDLEDEEVMTLVQGFKGSGLT
jgi:putative phosphoribosyl transferase